MHGTHSELGCPSREFGAPLIHEARRSHHESRVDGSRVEEDAKGCDGLNRLAQPHVVRQQHIGARQENTDAVQLKGQKVPRPVEDRPRRRKESGDRRRKRHP